MGVSEHTLQSRRPATWSKQKKKTTISEAKSKQPVAASKKVRSATVTPPKKTRSAVVPEKMQSDKKKTRPARVEEKRPGPKKSATLKTKSTKRAPTKQVAGKRGTPAATAGSLIFAAVQLGERKDSRTISPLVESLHDESLFVRQTAAGALENIGSPEAIAAVRRAEESGLLLGELPEGIILGPE